MSTTVAALKGKLGSTEYFVLSMKAKELVEKAMIPSEMEGWENLTLQEREQREINYKRVRDQIAPYFASNKDRFLGAIILTAKNFDPENFEPIADIATKGLPKLYKTQAQLMGFLTFTGGEELIPLDGQHRLKAIKFAIEGRDEKSKVISGFSPCSELANEDVTVMLFPYDHKKSRHIFTRVNKYAKQTTTGENLVIDDDDIIAVLSREIANDLGVIGPHLVNYKSNTLSDTDARFTTLATLAECNLAILEASFPGNIDRTHLPDESRVSLYKNKIFEVWKFLVTDIEKFAELLSDKEASGDRNRRELRKDYLIAKPAAQTCLVKAFVRLTSPETNLSYAQASAKLNKINWKKHAVEWDRLFVSGGKIITATKNKKLVTNILCYQAGEKLDEKQKNELLEEYRSLFHENEREDKKLPLLFEK